MNPMTRTLTDIDGMAAYDRSYLAALAARYDPPNDFDVSHMSLTTLNGCPEVIDGRFECKGNKLTSLEGAPAIVHGSFYMNNNPITSLKDIHHHVKRIDGVLSLRGCYIESHILGLLLIGNLRHVVMDTTEVLMRIGDILNQYIPSNGMESVLLCQEELINAGFEEYAQL